MDGPSEEVPDLAEALRLDPSGAEPSPDQLTDLLATLHPVQGAHPLDRLAALAPVIDRWQDPQSVVRRTLARHLPGLTGYSPEMIEVGLDLQCARLSVAALEEAFHERHPRLVNPESSPTAVVGAGNIPILTARDLLLSVLAGAPVAGKLPSAEPLSGAVLCHELARHLDGAAPAVSLRWLGGDRAREAVLFGWADRLLAYGSDATVTAIEEAYRRRRGDIGGAFQGFGHRISVAWLPANGFALDETAARLAVDTALWDQEGCLSPHVAFVSDGVDAVALGDRLATYLDRLETRVPRGRLPMESAAAVRRLTLATEARMLRDDRTRLWAGDRWAVILDPGEDVHPSPLGRTLILKPVTDEADLLRALAGWTGRLQCLGVADDPDAHVNLTTSLGSLGATRLCAVGLMQEPDPSWVGEERYPDGGWCATVESDSEGVWSTLIEEAPPPERG